MNRLIKRMLPGVVLGLLMTATSVYAADVPSTTAAQPEAAMPGHIPATGDEATSELAAETLRGKVLQSDGKLWTIETAPGMQVQMRLRKNTKFEGDYKGMTGDWIEALVTPDMHIKMIKKSTPGYTLEGDVLKVDGDFFVVKDPAGKEIRLRMDKDTKMIGSHKVGQRVKAEYTPDGRALSVKPVQIPRGPGGG